MLPNNATIKRLNDLEVENAKLKNYISELKEEIMRTYFYSHYLCLYPLKDLLNAGDSSKYAFGNDYMTLLEMGITKDDQYYYILKRFNEQ